MSPKRTGEGQLVVVQTRYGTRNPSAVPPHRTKHGYLDEGRPVCAHVLVEAKFLREPLGADWAGIGMGPCVALDVVLQVAFLREAAITKRAAERFLSGVCPFMSYHIGAVLRPVGAVAALNACSSLRGLLRLGARRWSDDPTCSVHTCNKITRFVLTNIEDGYMWATKIRPTTNLSGFYSTAINRLITSPSKLEVCQRVQ